MSWQAAFRGATAAARLEEFKKAATLCERGLEADPASAELLKLAEVGPSHHAEELKNMSMGISTSRSGMYGHCHTRRYLNCLPGCTIWGLPMLSELEAGEDLNCTESREGVTPRLGDCLNEEKSFLGGKRGCLKDGI